MAISRFFNHFKVQQPSYSSPIRPYKFYHPS